MQLNILSAQDTSIVAGVYDSTLIYYNYEPDTILPFGEFPIYSSSLNIDLDFDNVTDFEIYNLNATGNYASQYLVRITPYNNNEINYYRIDSLYSILWDSMLYYHVPKPFEYGEEINDSSLYTTSIGYLYRYSYVDLQIPHSIDDWKGTGDRYLGIRMNINDTMFHGWIRLKISNTGHRSKVTVMEYALSQNIESGIYNSLSIQVYPNPVGADLNIHLPENCKSGNVLIININGVTCKSQRILNSGLITINISDFKSGLYILKILTDSNIYYSRIIKQ